MNYLKITIGIFFILAASRFVPHPPNFTSLIALSFYVPALMGRKFIPAVIFSFLITDFIIGFHNCFLRGEVFNYWFNINFFKNNNNKNIRCDNWCGYFFYSYKLRCLGIRILWIFT